jgi:peptidyl-prolyl cis-trans isomerase D
VAGELKREVAIERARNELQAVHDAIEDQRSGAKPLAAIAAERGLTLVKVDGTDRSGSDKAGQPVAGVPDPNTVLPALFRSMSGADTKPCAPGAAGTHGSK